MSLTSSTTAATSLNPWNRILSALEKKINRHSYDTWLKPTRFSHASGDVLFIRVPTAEFRHIADKYADLISEAIDNLALEFSDVQFITAEEDPNTPPPVNVRHDGALLQPVRTLPTLPRAPLLRRRLPLGLRSRVSTGTRHRSSTRSTPLEIL